jgi:hypothetical protein
LFGLQVFFFSGLIQIDAWANRRWFKRDTTGPRLARKPQGPGVKLAWFSSLLFRYLSFFAVNASEDAVTPVCLPHGQEGALHGFGHAAGVLGLPRKNHM